MVAPDPIRELAHDHVDLNRRVLLLAQLLPTSSRANLCAVLDEIREDLFFHFAREEEGLFPFVAQHIPELDAPMQDLAIAHDAICGALARLIHMAAQAETRNETLQAVFERFEASYASHATSEANLLRGLEDRLDAAQRHQLAELVRGL